VTIAFVYPGQGAQHPGMVSALPDSPAGRDVLDRAVAVLGPIDDLDTTAGLSSTTNAQLALLICGVGAARTLAEEYGLSPDLVAGHSVGAFAAAVTAGVLEFAEALAAVQLRGEAMARACEPGQWGMAAVTGLGQRALAELVTSVHAGEDRLWIANVNGADQVVLGGTTAALALAREAARNAGARRFEPLDVAVASHGPVQQGTAAAMRTQLATVPRREQTASYLTNVGARRIRDDARVVLDDLANAVAKPVQWYDIARLLPELGADRVVEMPPGHVLSRLINSAAPHVEVFSVADDGFDAVAARVRAQ
jgi:malonate decarboxylase epsilon subunit